jgi:hypothetical protein
MIASLIYQLEICTIVIQNIGSAEIVYKYILVLFEMNQTRAIKLHIVLTTFTIYRGLNLVWNKCQWLNSTYFTIHRLTIKVPKMTIFMV